MEDAALVGRGSAMRDDRTILTRRLVIARAVSCSVSAQDDELARHIDLASQLNAVSLVMRVIL